MSADPHPNCHMGNDVPAVGARNPGYSARLPSRPRSLVRCSRRPAGEPITDSRFCSMAVEDQDVGGAARSTTSPLPGGTATWRSDLCGANSLRQNCECRRFFNVVSFCGEGSTELNLTGRESCSPGLSPRCLICRCKSTVVQGSFPPPRVVPGSSATVTQPTVASGGAVINRGDSP